MAQSIVHELGTWKAGSTACVKRKKDSWVDGRMRLTFMLVLLCCPILGQPFLRDCTLRDSRFPYSLVPGVFPALQMIHPNSSMSVQIVQLSKKIRSARHSHSAQPPQSPS